VLDPALCHGSAGLGHICGRLYRSLGDPEFLCASRYWHALTRQSVELALQRRILLGRLEASESFDGWASEAGLLDGAAGVGLSLLASVSSREPLWDSMLLLSPVAAPTPAEFAST
jgi:hypothetical protein